MIVLVNVMIDIVLYFQAFYIRFNFTKSASQVMLHMETGFGL